MVQGAHQVSGEQGGIGGEGRGGEGRVGKEEGGREGALLYIYQKGQCLAPARERGVLQGVH